MTSFLNVGALRQAPAAALKGYGEARQDEALRQAPAVALMGYGEAQQDKQAFFSPPKLSRRMERRDCFEAFTSIRDLKALFVATLLLLSPLTLSLAQDTQSSLALGDRTGAPNTAISVPIQVASNGGLVGLQFDVLYNPTDIDITGLTPGALSTDHTFLAETFDSGRQRVLVYSATNAVFDNGVIGALELDLSGTFPDERAALSFSNISFVTVDGTVLTVDVAPYVQLTDPTTSVAANELDDLNLSAIAIATDGEVAHVEFQVDGRTIGMDTEGPYSVAWAVDAPGNVLVTAVAIDADGDRGTSTGIEVSVTSSPFLDAWRAANFNAEQRADAGISGFNSDPDGDHIINFFELAFKLEPLIADLSNTPMIEIIEENGNRFLALNYQRPAGMTELIYTVEVSTDMTNWTSTPETISETILEEINGIEKILARSLSPLSGDSDFIRVRIEPAP
jgi:hypothetical protein